MEMILAVWWVFLVAALILTVIDVYLLVRVVNLSRGIRVLSSDTLIAAAGTVRNTAASEPLQRTVQLVGGLAGKAGALDPLTAAVVRRLTQQEN